VIRRRGFTSLLHQQPRGSDAPLNTMFRFMLLALAAMMALRLYFLGGIHIEAAKEVALSVLHRFGR
jgi:hypothetical protein